MADPNPERDDDWAALSSMADGEAADPEMQERCLALWAGDAQARERWRDYQLIGDVLRSQELARDGSHDAAFVRALRARMTNEPIVLRPNTPPLAAARSRNWAVPMAAVAGVAAVAGMVVVLRGVPDGGAPTVAQQGNAAPMVATSAAAPQQMPTAQVVNGRLIRDARLDRYFAAHRQSANGAALQMPGAVVRSVDTIVLEDR
jgi:sigma-E factor negative regulatory protein RseA